MADPTPPQPALEPTSVRAARFLVGSAALLFAVWTVMTQVALLAGFSFAALADTYSVVAGLVVVGSVVAALRRRTVVGERDGTVCLALFALALLGGALALFAIRPDLDDVGYISRSVYFLAHPDVPLDLAYHDLALLDIPLVYPLRMAHTVEHFWGWIARWTGLPYLKVYHQVAPFLGGFFLPLGWFLALHSFRRRSPSALLGTAAIVAYLCIDGSTHRSFGNVAFVRIWQGKLLLMSVFVPIYVAAAREWFAHPNARRWLYLFLLSVGASGLSATSLFFVPVLSGLLGIAGFAGLSGPSGARPLPSRLRVTARFWASLAYLVALAAYLWFSASSADYEYIGYEIFPSTFSGQVELLFGEGLSFTLIVALASTVAALWVTRGTERRFLLAWILAALVLVLNPIVMPWVCRLATYNAYWRLFFVFPFPLALGVACAGALTPTRHVALVQCAALLLAAAGFQRLAPGVGAFGNEVRFGVGEDKVDARLGAEVREIVAACSPGSMVAPNRYSCLIPLYTSELPQVCVRSWLLKHFAGIAGQPGIARSRMRAVKYVGGKDAGGLQDLRALIRQGVRHVVIDARREGDPKLAAALEEASFERVKQAERYSIYSRPQP